MYLQWSIAHSMTHMFVHLPPPIELLDCFSNGLFITSECLMGGIDANPFFSKKRPSYNHNFCDSCDDKCVWTCRIKLASRAAGRVAEFSVQVLSSGGPDPVIHRFPKQSQSVFMTEGGVFVWKPTDELVENMQSCCLH